VKVTAPRTIVIQEDGQKPVRFTDASKAAEHWARIKEQEWIEKHKAEKKYIGPTYGHRGPTVLNTLYDDARIRYRKLKRRAQTIFRRKLAE
jgi:hypothetical protein